MRQPPPDERAMRASIAAHTQWANTTDRTARTREAVNASQRALNAQLTAELDPDGTMPPDELAQRLDSARRAHFQRLAYRSARARRAAAQTAERSGHDAAAAEASIAQHIQRVVDVAPPLTTEQRDRLAALLRAATPNGPA